MTISIGLDATRKRAQQLPDIFKCGDLDGFLTACRDDVQFLIPVRPQSAADVGMAGGAGKTALRACLSEMHGTGAPYRLLDVFGTARSRSAVLEDALGNRLLLTVETDAAGLTSNVFAMRTRTGVQLAA